INHFLDIEPESVENLLFFYQNLLFIDGLKSLRQKFNNNEMLINKGYSFLKEYDYYIKDEMVEDNGTMPSFVTSIIKRDNFCSRLLVLENINVFKDLDSKINSITSEKKKTEFLCSFLDDLKIMLQKVVKSKENDAEL